MDALDVISIVGSLRQGAPRNHTTNPSQVIRLGHLRAKGPDWSDGTRWAGPGPGQPPCHIGPQAGPQDLRSRCMEERIVSVDSVVSAVTSGHLLKLVQSLKF